MHTVAQQSDPLAPLLADVAFLLFIHCSRVRGPRRIKQNKATANQSPCLGFVDEEPHSKRTTTRQQLDCAKTL
jgi:hypothetical protein